MEVLTSVLPFEPTNNTLARAVYSLRPDKRDLILGFLAKDVLSKHVYLGDIVPLLSSGDEAIVDPEKHRSEHTTIVCNMQTLFKPKYGCSAHRFQAKRSMVGQVDVQCPDGTFVRLVHPLKHVYHASGVIDVPYFLA